MREDFADRNKIKKTARQGRIIRFCQVVFFEHDIMLLCSYCYNVGEKGGVEEAEYEDCQVNRDFIHPITKAEYYST